MIIYVKNNLMKEGERMSKQKKEFYCNLGQAVCNVTQLILLSGIYGLMIAYMFLR